MVSVWEVSVNVFLTSRSLQAGHWGGGHSPLCGAGLPFPVPGPPPAGLGAAEATLVFAGVGASHVWVELVRRERSHNPNRPRSRVRAACEEAGRE